MIIGAVLIGAVVGFLTGVFGVGGGFLMTPALMVLLSVPGPIAVGTCLAVILATGSFGLLKRIGSNTVDIKLACTIACGSVVGVIVGSWLLQLLKEYSEAGTSHGEIGLVQYVLLWSFLVLLVGVGAYLLWDYERNGGKAPKTRLGYFSKVHIPPYGRFSSLERPCLSVLPLVALGLCIGILVGFMGVGGGVLLLPALVFLVGQRTSKAAGTSLLLVCISSFAGVILKSKTGDVNIRLFLALLIGGAIGTLVGTEIGLKLAGPRIRLYFVFVIAVAVLVVAYKLLSAVC